MELKTTAKIGIFTGIAAIVFFSVIFAMAMADNIFESVMRTFLDKDKVMKELKADPTVLLFAETFPNHYVEERKHRHNMELELFDYNFETGNQLRLNVHYDMWDDRVNQYIRCDVSDNTYRSGLGMHTDFALSASSISYPQVFLNEGRAENQFVLDFIKYTNCLEMGGDSKNTRETSAPHKNSASDAYVEIPLNTGHPGCEETNTCYSPNRVEITEGQIVDWKNIDNVEHTITSGTPFDGPTDYFDSEIINSGQSFRVQFDKAGEYNYFCMIHPWQEGLVVVEETTQAKATGSYTLEE